MNRAGRARGQAGRAGFSLVEAVVALTVSTLLVVAAGNLFLVQNSFYGFLVQRSQVQENARSFTELVSADLTSLVGEGLLVAEPDRMVVRVPQSLAGLCLVQGANTYVHWVSPDALDVAHARGFAVLDSLGEWSFHSAPVASVAVERGRPPAAACARVYADTLGAGTDFGRLRRLGNYVPGTPREGDVVMVYEEIEFSIDTSVLDPRLLALFRGHRGETPTEYTTGVAPDARFRYRVAGAWRDRAAGAVLDQVDAVRIEASTLVRGTGPDARFGVILEVPLRNRLP